MAARSASPAPKALPTLRVLPQGISRKRLEQAIRELQLPVVIARDVDEADVVMTLRSEYKQKTPMLREAEERAMPIYVLKSNTIPQMQASLTSIFSLEIDPREAALRETEEAIGLVLKRSEAVELSPQNAYIRRLQHQMAERANLVSRSRGREPYRRVRLYPDAGQERLALTPPAAPETTQRPPRRRHPNPRRTAPTPHPPPRRQQPRREHGPEKAVRPEPPSSAGPPPPQTPPTLHTDDPVGHVERRAAVGTWQYAQPVCPVGGAAWVEKRLPGRRARTPLGVAAVGHTSASEARISSIEPPVV